MEESTVRDRSWTILTTFPMKEPIKDKTLVV
jgi:hypothetical protein